MGRAGWRQDRGTAARIKTSPAATWAEGLRDRPGAHERAGRGPHPRSRGLIAAAGGRAGRAATDAPTAGPPAAAGSHDDERFTPRPRPRRGRPRGAPVPAPDI